MSHVSSSTATGRVVMRHDAAYHGDMTMARDQEALAAAAHDAGFDVDPDQLLRIVHAAFAPRETMTGAERAFLLDAGGRSDSFDPHTQARARARLTARAAQTRAAASRLLPTSEVATLLGRAASNVRRSAGAGDLYAITGGPSRELEFPAWQFVNGRPLRGLREVTGALTPGMHPLSVEGFMTSPHEELEGRTPIDWLSTGGAVESVVDLAETAART